MEIAINEAYDGVNNSHGGPFGAVIVKDDKIVGKGHNCVLKDNDPTQHGEIMAIKNACQNLGTYDLSGCSIYTTAEPCPMCLGAILWANISNVYYGCSREESKNIGFKDNEFYDVVLGKVKRLNITTNEKEKCLELFKYYSSRSDNVIY